MNEQDKQAMVKAEEFYTSNLEPNEIGYAPLDFKAGWQAALEYAQGKQEPVAKEITGETSDGYHTFNELYAHRVRLFSILMWSHQEKAWWSRKHADGTGWDGWIIAGIDTPKGSATYHLPESELEHLPNVEIPLGKKWDGHTSQDVLTRLLSLNSRPPAAEVNENLIKILTHFMPFIESERDCPYQKPWVEKAEAAIAAAHQGKGEQV